MSRRASARGSRSSRQCRLNVTIRLARGAAISGRIVDEDGDPVIEAGVSAGRLARSGNGLKMVPLKSTTTDDLGEYRLIALGKRASAGREPLEALFGKIGCGRAEFGLRLLAPLLIS